MVEEVSTKQNQDHEMTDEGQKFDNDLVSPELMFAMKQFASAAIAQVKGSSTALLKSGPAFSSKIGVS